MCRNGTPEGRPTRIGRLFGIGFSRATEQAVIWESLLAGASVTVAVLVYRLWAQRKARETRLMIKRIAYLEWPSSEGID
jgi:hypothetical protein